MKKLFIHNPFFRLLSPIFSGCLGYLLILLINNDVSAILEQLLGMELLFCVCLSYLIHEVSRGSLLFFEKTKIPTSYGIKLSLQISSSILLSIILVSLAVQLYFTSILDYSPNMRELLIFNSIFATISGIYIALHLSHQFLYKQNTEKLADELEKTEQIEEDFQHFRKGLNPTLLFECLESLIVLLQEGPEPSEQFLDEFSSVYRYILSSGRKDLLPFKEEEKALQALIELFAYLPFRKSNLHIAPKIQTYIIPGSILQTIELIIRTSIISQNSVLDIHIREKEDFLEISYTQQERLLAKLGINELNELKRSYSYYSDKDIQVIEEEKLKVIRFPLLLAHSIENSIETSIEAEHLPS